MSTDVVTDKGSAASNIADPVEHDWQPGHRAGPQNSAHAVRLRHHTVDTSRRAPRGHPWKAALSDPSSAEPRVHVVQMRPGFSQRDREAAESAAGGPFFGYLPESAFLAYARPAAMAQAQTAHLLDLDRSFGDGPVAWFGVMQSAWKLAEGLQAAHAEHVARRQQRVRAKDAEKGGTQPLLPFLECSLMHCPAGDRVSLYQPDDRVSTRDFSIHVHFAPAARALFLQRLVTTPCVADLHAAVMPAARGHIVLEFPDEIASASPVRMGSCLSALAADAAVHWIEPRDLLQAANGVARTIALDGSGSSTATATSAFYAAGITGANQTVGVLDTGLDAQHVFFYDANTAVPFSSFNAAHRKIVRYASFASSDQAAAGYDDHGTHTIGTLLGSPLSAADSSYLNRGMAPDAKVTFFDAADASGFHLPSDWAGSVLGVAYTDGARVHSDSWTASGEWLARVRPL
jgi:subtilisin family serine protease